MKDTIKLPSVKQACENVQRDLASITSIVNGKLHMECIHEKLDIFFYIDSSIQAREICSQLKAAKVLDVNHYKQLVDLHDRVIKKWEKDKYSLSPERKIIL